MTTPTCNILPLIQKLTEKQRALGLNDAQFGLRLGLSCIWWNQVRLGYAHLGKGSIARVMQEFPELMPDVLVYLRGDKEESQ